VSNRVASLIMLVILWADIGSAIYLGLLPFYLPLWVPLTPIALTIAVPLVLLTWDLIYIAFTGRDE
jgi:hypothetical protein